MNAIQFIKEHGVEKAREVVECAPDLAEYYSAIDGEYYRIEINAVNLKQLKRLVESVDMVREYGGISMAKRQCACFTNACTSVGVKPSPGLSALQQAIADYKAIHSFDIEKREFELGLAPDSDYVKGGEHV